MSLCLSPMSLRLSPCPCVSVPAPGSVALLFLYVPLCLHVHTSLSLCVLVYVSLFMPPCTQLLKDRYTDRRTFLLVIEVTRLLFFIYAPLKEITQLRHFFRKHCQ